MNDTIQLNSIEDVDNYLTLVFVHLKALECTFRVNDIKLAAELCEELVKGNYFYKCEYKYKEYCDDGGSAGVHQYTTVYRYTEFTVYLNLGALKCK